MPAKLIIFAIFLSTSCFSILSYAGVPRIDSEIKQRRRAFRHAQPVNARILKFGRKEWTCNERAAVGNYNNELNSRITFHKDRDGTIRSHVKLADGREGWVRHDFNGPEGLVLKSDEYRDSCLIKLTSVIRWSRRLNALVIEGSQRNVNCTLSAETVPSIYNPDQVTSAYAICR